MKESFDKELALRLLKEHGIAKVIIEFSGGNDEGGVDSASYFRSDTVKSADGEDEKVDVPETSELSRACEASVYAKYTSFAGDFYVNGNVTFDVEAGTVVMEADEQIPTSHPFVESY